MNSKAFLQMNDLLVHPLTKRQINLFLASPSHAVLLVGRKGCGKLELARDIASELLYEHKGVSNNDPYVLEICLLYTSDAADDLLCGDIGGRRIIKEKRKRR